MTDSLAIPQIGRALRFRNIVPGSVHSGLTNHSNPNRFHFPYGWRSPSTLTVCRRSVLVAATWWRPQEHEMGVIWPDERKAVNTRRQGRSNPRSKGQLMSGRATAQFVASRHPKFLVLG